MSASRRAAELALLLAEQFGLRLGAMLPIREEAPLVRKVAQPALRADVAVNAPSRGRTALPSRSGAGARVAVTKPRSLRDELAWNGTPTSLAFPLSPVMRISSGWARLHDQWKHCFSGAAADDSENAALSAGFAAAPCSGTIGAGHAGRPRPAPLRLNAWEVVEGSALSPRGRFHRGEAARARRAARRPLFAMHRLVPSIPAASVQLRRRRTTTGQRHASPRFPRSERLPSSVSAFEASAHHLLVVDDKH